MVGVLLTLASVAAVAALIWMRMRSGIISPNANLLIDAYRQICGRPSPEPEDAGDDAPE